jgi:uncharacterized membrane protein YoaK (UPF0700 family)
MQAFDGSAEISQVAEPRPFVSFAVALSLTWMAGFVDAVGFLTFARVYTANMSGNSVAVGIFLARQQWPTFLFRLWPVILYVVGLIWGRALLQFGALRRIRHIASIAFACEIVLLGVVATLGNAAKVLPLTEWQYIAVALLAVAMGIQNSALTQFSSLTLHSGFVTGSLLKFSEQFVAYATWVLDRTHRGRPLLQILKQSIREPSFRLSLLLASTWIAYVIGAASGAFGRDHAAAKALMIPVFGLFALILVDRYRPLALREERKQANLA